LQKNSIRVKKITFLVSLALFLVLAVSPRLYSQSKNVKLLTVGFYNLENLFDTIDDPNTDDAEFLPGGTAQWDTKRYQTKLSHMASVIAQIGDEYIKTGPVVMGFSEVENRGVVQDLINTPPLNTLGYKICHFDSPDKRGVDVALIYQSRFFNYISSKPHKLTIPGKTDFYTRDILEVHGTFEGESFYFLVNHWPSRRGGASESQYLRNAAADLARSITDSITKADPGAKIIIMGDLNDDPIDESLIKHLKAKAKPEECKTGDLYDPMIAMYKKGMGTLAYKDAWNLFDQIVVSSTLVSKDAKGFHFLNSKIFNRDFLKEKEGQYAGYPNRTYVGGVYMGGYSDHFPVYIFLVKEQ
jgi:hypothetical protein